MNSQTVPARFTTTFPRWRGILEGFIFNSYVQGATMTKKALFSLSLFLLAGTLMMLVPSEIRAQVPLCPRPYAFAWDWGVQPFDSPFGYLDGPVDPTSAEWGPLDACYGCWWANNVWVLGYGMDPDRWWYNMWLRTGSRKLGSDSRGHDVALLRPIPALTYRGSPHPKRPSLGSGTGPSSLLSSHQGPTYNQPQAAAGYGGAQASSGGGSGRTKR